MFAAVLLPSFHLQAALRFEPELHRQPVALLSGPGPAGAIVTETTVAARAADVHAGFTASQALARCPRLQLRRRLPRQEHAAAEILRQTAWAFSAWLEDTADGLCTLDLRGRAEIDHRPWVLALVRRLAAQQLFARIGVAANPDLARLAARRARPFLQITEVAAFLAPLSLSDLDPDPTLEMIIGGWGVRTLGALTALPREAVGDRLGPSGVALWDRAAGRTTRTLRFAQLIETYAEVVEFEHGLETLEPLLFVLRRCLEQITQRLADVWLVIAGLNLTLRCDDGTVLERAFTIPDPTGDVDVLFRVLHHYFETLRTEAPVVALELSVRPTKPVGHQFGLFQAALKDPNGFAETLARLAAVVGDDRVGTPQLESTHRPDAFRVARVDFAAPPPVPGLVAERPPRYGPALRRYRPAVTAQVCCDPSGQPLHVEASEASGGIRFALGPWRGSGDWWEEPQAWNDEEWDVELEPGRLFRLSRRGEAWWVIGGYD